MKAIFKKAIQRSKMIFEGFYEKWWDYSFSYAVVSTLWWLGWYSHMNKITMWAFKKKKSYIFNYIDNNYSESLKKYSTCPYDQTNSEFGKHEFPIWVFWAQGFDNAPELVQMCYKNLIKTEKNVRALTLDNFMEYVDIPERILQRLKKGEISSVNFSDILRVSLLAKHGGLWVDSTCWLASKIPQHIKSLNFISPRANGCAPLPLCSDSRWCAWSLGTNYANNKLFHIVKLILETHAQESKVLIDHFLIDYAICYAYENFECVKSMMDACPENNTKRNELHFLLNTKFEENKYQQVIKNDWLFKLSYKTQWRKIDRDGDLTFYGEFLKDNDLETHKNTCFEIIKNA